MTWKVLAATSFRSVTAVASTFETIAGNTPVTVPAGKTWIIDEILLTALLATAGKMLAYAIYILRSGGTDLNTGDVPTFTTATWGFSDGVAAAKANTVLPLMSPIAGLGGVTVLARNTMLAAGDSIRMAWKSGATVPAAGDFSLAIAASGAEF